MESFYIRELEFQMCCMALGLLIHCYQCSSQSRASVTRGGLCSTPRTEQLKKTCTGFQRSRFVVLACSRPTAGFGFSWTRQASSVRFVKFAPSPEHFAQSHPWSSHFTLLKRLCCSLNVRLTVQDSLPSSSSRVALLGADFYCLTVVNLKKQQQKKNISTPGAVMSTWIK